MIESCFLELLTAKVQISGIFDPNWFEIHELDAELDLPLSSIVGISRYSIDGEDVFVVCTTISKGVVTNCDESEQCVAHFVTNELVYRMIHELNGLAG